ncbi:hypothetical protein E2C01_020499 [Portunus trituberculatus]|uniref:Uncharacterized protein n=1 Tax=Portunus trituberculatus TaxID=210409 RepID=A0A5B7DZY0_PORTR|nr:hypothetical protein [Portunus trituberculatus]
MIIKFAISRAPATRSYIQGIIGLSTAAVITGTPEMGGFLYLPRSGALGAMVSCLRRNVCRTASPSSPHASYTRKPIQSNIGN